ncbi:hypothetical protein MO973_37695 [Paenibacillus sp. TRM 82003]|nr:hypothetical protein [Kineococcus sp. TRM81007]MCI2237927.1 hypothetical protein [Kineococcus sp. TRM81007]MCI3925940.1 hypothetical protein [Paenibacillus sp. TRM 82003]
MRVPCALAAISPLGTAAFRELLGSGARVALDRLLAEHHRSSAPPGT